MTEKDNPNEGLFIVEGGELSISGMTFTINEKGEINLEPAAIRLRLDVCPEWLEIAIDHLETNTLSAEDIQNALKIKDDKIIGEALKKEFRYGMQSIVASCTAVEAFFEIICELANIPDDLKDSWRKNRTPKYARIAEAIKIAFNINNKTVEKIREYLKESFSYRDKAVHPHQDFMPPALHPELNRVVDIKFVLFRHYNARTILHTTLSLIYQLCRYDKIKKKEIKTYSKQLLGKLKPIVEIWESNYGTL